jgi:hypothetical protein
LAGSVIACQLLGPGSGSEGIPTSQGSAPVLGADSGPAATAAPAGQSSAPVLGAGDSSTEAAAPVETQSTPQDSGSSALISGSGAGEAAVQPANIAAQPARVAEVLDELLVLETGIYKTVGSVGQLLVVENPNADVAIQDTRCQVTAFDSGGAVLETDECNIGLLFAGERRTIYTGLSLPAGVQPERLDFQITRQGQPVLTSLNRETLSVERVKYWPEKGRVTGVVTNSSEFRIDMPILTAVFHDEQGQVIGVGKEFSSGFIPPMGYAGVSVVAPMNLAPARVDLLVVPQADWTIKSVIPERPTLVLGRTQIFRDSGMDTGEVIFYVSNANTDRSIALLPFQITAFDAEGFVIGTHSTSAPVIFPGEQVAVQSGAFYLMQDSSIADIDVNLSPIVEESLQWDYAALGIEKNPLSATDAQYQEGNPPTVDCVLKNAWKNPVDGVMVLAVAFDADENIVGYGWNSAQVPSEGQSAFKIWLTMAADFQGTPTQIELFPYISNPTGIR